ncbi:MAG: hypothetical protein U9N82_06140 [Thermodesulfobacteriota bacterium]|nr:hypothetical protein [Thermodesulfobacteriota bacterium]
MEAMRQPAISLIPASAPLTHARRPQGLPANLLSSFQFYSNQMRSPATAGLQKGKAVKDKILNRLDITCFQKLFTYLAASASTLPISFLKLIAEGVPQL